MADDEGGQRADGPLEPANAVQSLQQKVQQAFKREGPRSNALGLEALLVCPLQPDLQPAGQPRPALEKACLPAAAIITASFHAGRILLLLFPR